MKMHNLSTVIKFEIIRMLKKPSFWLLALGFPLIISAVFGIVFFSNKATMEAADKLKDQQFSIGVTDEAQLISPALLSSVKAKSVQDKQTGVSRVESGHLDAYFFYPRDITRSPIEVYGKDVGLFDNSRYDSLANFLLKQSVDDEVSADKRAVLAGSVRVNTTMFKDGQKYDAVKEMIAPGLFLVLFYMLIGFFGGQMLNSTIEEKENRTIEMLLTTVNARTLIAGKILSLVLLALIQAAVILIPVLAMYFIAGPSLEIANFDISNLPLDPQRITVAALIFAFSFVMFTGLLVAVGSAMPTAKEASQWFGMVMLLIFGPLYGFSAFISYPDSPFVKFLSLFPLTSPIPLMLRNAVGNLDLPEAVLGITILAVTSIAVLLLAVKVFQLGAMQYDSKLSLRALRQKRSERA